MNGTNGPGPAARSEYEYAAAGKTIDRPLYLNTGGGPSSHRQPAAAAAAAAAAAPCTRDSRPDDTHSTGPPRAVSPREPASGTASSRGHARELRLPRLLGPAAWPSKQSSIGPGDGDEVAVPAAAEQGRRVWTAARSRHANNTATPTGWRAFRPVRGLKRRRRRERGGGGDGERRRERGRQ